MIPFQGLNNPRPEELNDIFSKSPPCSSYSFFFYLTFKPFQQIPFDIFLVIRMAVPAEEADGEFGRGKPFIHFLRSLQDLFGQL